MKDRNLMIRSNPPLFTFVSLLASALVLLLTWMLSFKAQSVQAGSGITIDIPASNTVPTMDGVCGPSEYNDATQVSITVPGGTFPVFMKHTASDAYFCFGDPLGLPLPSGGGGPQQVAVYIDRNDDGLDHQSDDFGIWMPYDPGGSPWARYWGAGFYTGADPGGWQAVKHQTPWQVEFQISLQTIGGWKHTVGLALFYHWWGFQGDDYSWPTNGIWASPQWWGNGHFTTGEVVIGYSPTVPTMDGLCGPEYDDSSSINFTAPGGVVTAYLEHSLTDLHVCLKNLTIPSLALQNGPNAALYIDRVGTGGGTPGENDLLFTISHSGIIHASSGDGSGYTGPDPGGHVIVRANHGGVWDAEFQISGATIGKWWSRSIGLAVAEQGVANPNDYFGWPTGYYSTIPNSWGKANLTQLGNQNYLPVLVR
jgi:hypothetical protein